jgi:GNAT superfamily N-acetyltransferase
MQNPGCSNRLSNILPRILAFAIQEANINKHVNVRSLDAGEAQARIAELSALLLDCVEGGASVSFMLPLTSSTADTFWHGVAAGVARGERTLIVALDDADAIIGTVQLITDMPPNQPHRADVAKLLVRRSARGAGVGQRLMQAAHAAARAQGKTLLVLDTASDGAERLYTRLGWQRVGTVPDYALLPDGGLCATTFFFKRIE